jgi:hypothetical protein
MRVANFMTNADIAHHRLYNLGISEPKFGTVGELVSWLGAVQAQDYPGTLWALGLRMNGATVADIEKAIADRQIVRTWPMRGTLHFVAADDIRWMLELMASRALAGAESRRRQLELDDTTLALCGELITAALQGGKQMSRAELCEVLERGNISTAGQRGYHIVGNLAHKGLLCFGTHAGKEPTLTLLDEWLPATRKPARDEALAELAKRYFNSHGPATLQDFVWWTGLKVADARAGMEAVKSDFAQETVEGQTYWLPPNVNPPVQKQSSTVYLLPGFDEFLLAYRDRRAVLDPEHAQKVVPGSNGVFMNTIVSDGRVVGLWKRATKKNNIVVTPSPFETLSPSQIAALTPAAEHYGRFLGLPAQVNFVAETTEV